MPAGADIPEDRQSRPQQSFIHDALGQVAPLSDPHQKSHMKAGHTQAEQPEIGHSFQHGKAEHQQDRQRHHAPETNDPVQHPVGQMHRYHRVAAIVFLLQRTVKPGAAQGAAPTIANQLCAADLTLHGHSTPLPHSWPSLELRRHTGPDGAGRPAPHPFQPAYPQS